MYRKLLPLALLCATPAFADVRISAVSQPSPYGQTVNAAVLEYAKPIAAGAVSGSLFQVADRNISDAFVSKRPDCIDRVHCAASSGKFVVLRLSPQDPTAAVTYHEGRNPSIERNIVLDVTQKSTLKAANGNRLAPFSAQSSKVVHQIVDDFKQLEFKDPASGIVVKYNLFVPKNYRPNKRYPLVMFIHDAGATNSNTRNTLLQGTGATAFADPVFQKRHEAFVLAPQFDHIIVNDHSDDPADLDPTVNLIHALEKQYSIDSDRIYTTGQSGGAMMSIAMNIKYPDLFAASYLVAGQWAAEKTPPMAKNKLFILVSQDDKKAYPGENAITEELAKHGAIVRRTVLDNGSDIEAMNSQIKELLLQPGNVYYAAIRSGTLPDQVKNPNSSNPGAAHVGTWKVSYELDSVKDWLLQQHK